MKKTVKLLLLSVIIIFLLSMQAHAYVQGNGYLCVNAVDLGTDFQTALDEISLNNRPDSNLRLIQGTFAIASNANGHFNIDTNHSLTISGGWNADCSLQTPDSQLTILQGGTTQENPGGVLSVIITDNVSSLTTVEISNLTIQNGTSELDGGGLSFEHDFTGTAALVTLNISDIITQSNSTDTFGSGIAVFDWGTNGGLRVNITDSIVQNNSVPGNSDGGPAGIYIDNFGSDVEVAISRCQVLNNMAVLDGGGIYINSGAANATLVNNIIAGNSVSDDNGGGIYIINTDGGDSTLTNNTLTENSSTGTTADFQDGGGVYAYLDIANNSSKLALYNNIIFNNSAVGYGADIFIFNPVGNKVAIKNNDFSTSEPSGFYIESRADLSQEKNLNDIPPLFEGASVDNYHLTALSPVIAMGDNSAPAVPSEDLNGLPRPVNGTVDLGAYEYQGAVSTTTTTTLPGGTTTTTTLPATTTTSSTTTTSTTSTSTTLPGATTTTTVPSSGGGGGGGGGGIFGDILKNSVIGYHLDGFTKEGIQIYMPVTPGYKALKGAQEYVSTFAPNLAEFVRECFDSLEKRADENKDGFLYQLGTHLFPLLGKIAEEGLELIGQGEYISDAYSKTTIGVEEYKQLEKRGFAIAPKTVKENKNQGLDLSETLN